MRWAVGPRRQEDSTHHVHRPADRSVGAQFSRFHGLCLRARATMYLVTTYSSQQTHTAERQTPKTTTYYRTPYVLRIQRPLRASDAASAEATPAITCTERLCAGRLPSPQKRRGRQRHRPPTPCLRAEQFLKVFALRRNNKGYIIRTHHRLHRSGSQQKQQQRRRRRQQKQEWLVELFRCGQIAASHCRII